MWETDFLPDVTRPENRDVPQKGVEGTFVTKLADFAAFGETTPLWKALQGTSFTKRFGTRLPKEHKALRQGTPAGGSGKKKCHLALFS